MFRILVNAESVPELALRMNFLSTFANATDQASKLGMGKNNAIISMYENFQVSESESKHFRTNFCVLLSVCS